MNNLFISLPELSQLVERRMALVRSLAESLESMTPALVRNDAQAIARGAAHQAELCRQWSDLEAALRRQAALQRTKSPAASSHPPASNHTAQLQIEWDALGARIRYVTRVHWSLLRHLERSLAVLQRLVDSCAPTYARPLSLLKPETRIQVGE
jgi:hypothetical protein